MKLYTRLLCLFLGMSREQLNEKRKADRRVKQFRKRYSNFW